MQQLYLQCCSSRRAATAFVSRQQWRRLSMGKGQACRPSSCAMHSAASLHSAGLAADRYPYLTRGFFTRVAFDRIARRCAWSWGALTCKWILPCYLPKRSTCQRQLGRLFARRLTFSSTFFCRFSLPVPPCGKCQICVVAADPASNAPGAAHATHKQGTDPSDPLHVCFSPVPLL